MPTTTIALKRARSQNLIGQSSLVSPLHLHHLMHWQHVVVQMVHDAERAGNKTISVTISTPKASVATTVGSTIASALSMILRFAVPIGPCGSSTPRTAAMSLQPKMQGMEMQKSAAGMWRAF